MDFGPFSTRPRRSCSSKRAPAKLSGLGREGLIWSSRTTGPQVQPNCRFARVSWIFSGQAGVSGRTSNSRSSPPQRSRNGAGDVRRHQPVPTHQAARLQVPNFFDLFGFLGARAFDSHSNFPTLAEILRFVSRSYFRSLVAPVYPRQFPSFSIVLFVRARISAFSDQDSEVKSLPDTSMGPRATFQWEAPGLSLTLPIVFSLIREHGSAA